MAQIAATQVGAAEIGTGKIAAIEAAGAEIGLAQHGAIEAGETEIGALKIRPAQIGELIEPRSKVGLHQAGATPEALSRQHPLQTGPVELGVAEIGGLEAATGKIRLLPAGATGPQAGEVGAPDQGPLKAASADIGAAQAGMTEAGLRKAAVPEVAAAQIEIDTIATIQSQTREMAASTGKGDAQGLQGGRIGLLAQPSLWGCAAVVGFSHGAVLGAVASLARWWNQRLAARASSCWRLAASNRASAWERSVNTAGSITS